MERRFERLAFRQRQERRFQGRSLICFWRPRPLTLSGACDSGPDNRAVRSTEPRRSFARKSRVENPSQWKSVCSGPLPNFLREPGRDNANLQRLPCDSVRRRICSDYGNTIPRWARTRSALGWIYCRTRSAPVSGNVLNGSRAKTKDRRFNLQSLTVALFVGPVRVIIGWQYASCFRRVCLRGT